MTEKFYFEKALEALKPGLNPDLLSIAANDDMTMNSYFG